MRVCNISKVFLSTAFLLSCSGFEDIDLVDSEISRDVTVQLSGGEQYGLDAKWQDEALDLDKPEFDIHFLLGDGRNFHDVHSAKLDYPDIERQLTDRVSTAEVIGNEQRLVDYYRQIFEAARKYDIPFTEISHQFWIRPKIYDKSGTVKFNFSAYDTLLDTKRFKEWLDSKYEGSLFIEYYQGWAMEAQIKDGFVYLIEYNPDHDAHSEGCRIPYEHLKIQTSLAVGRAQNIIKTLAETLGTDVWSRYRGYPWDNLDL